MLIAVVIILVLVVAVIIITAAKPNTFRVERTSIIDAKPAKIFAVLNDFHNWNAWSPWESLDPELKRTFSGSPSGKGAVYEWEGNKKVGAGRMEILESDPALLLLIQLDFYRPMKARNTTEFTLSDEGGKTRVIWAMFGASSFMHKLMSSVMNLDKLVGGDFEKGLANLKTISESRV